MVGVVQLKGKDDGHRRFCIIRAQSSMCFEIRSSGGQVKLYLHLRGYYHAELKFR